MSIIKTFKSDYHVDEGLFLVTQKLSKDLIIIFGDKDKKLWPAPSESNLPVNFQKTIKTWTDQPKHDTKFGC